LVTISNVFIISFLDTQVLVPTPLEPLN
jgi:hypothetical protein